MNSLLIIGIPVVAVLLSLVTVGLIVSRLYRKTTPAMAMVRTGAGGKRIIQHGGALIIPIMHEVTEVSMKTLGLDISRTHNDALITQNRMRVDVGAKFYVRVKPDADGILRAAQTLGDRTFDVSKLRDMIEDKLVDALRTVAATMTMDDLHENRSNFVQKVQEAVDNDLLQNGLELESVSLTTLDQTPFEHLDENNAFNAVGMKQLAAVIAQSREERAQIEANAQVKVAEAEKSADLETYRIKQETEEARISQERAVSEAQSRASAEMATAEELSTQNQETARIVREEAVAVANQDRLIAINEKSMEESKARTAADEARAEAMTMEESVVTAGEVAAADRRKQIAIIAAQELAETKATSIRVAAAAEKAAAEDHADAILIEAAADATAAEAKARGNKAIALADAEGQTALIGAENALSSEVIEMKVQLARLEALPRVVEQMVKPAEHIDQITLHNVTGLGGSVGGGESASGNGGGAAGGISDALMSVALQYPALKALGEQAGINIGDGFAGVLADDTAEDEFESMLTTMKQNAGVGTTEA